MHDYGILKLSPRGDVWGYVQAENARKRGNEKVRQRHVRKLKEIEICSNRLCSLAGNEDGLSCVILAELMFLTAYPSTKTYKISPKRYPDD